MVCVCVRVCLSRSLSLCVCLCVCVCVCVLRKDRQNRTNVSMVKGRSVCVCARSRLCVCVMCCVRVLTCSFLACLGAVSTGSTRIQLEQHVVDRMDVDLACRCGLNNEAAVTGTDIDRMYLAMLQASQSGHWYAVQVRNNTNQVTPQFQAQRVELAKRSRRLQKIGEGSRSVLQHDQVHSNLE